jgi:hypothetical protein
MIKQAVLATLAIIGLGTSTPADAGHRHGNYYAPHYAPRYAPVRHWGHQRYYHPRHVYHRTYWAPRHHSYYAPRYRTHYVYVQQPYYYYQPARTQYRYYEDRSDYGYRGGCRCDDDDYRLNYGDGYGY